MKFAVRLVMLNSPSLRKPIARHLRGWGPYLVLAGALLLTAVAAWQLRTVTLAQDQQRFDNSVNAIRTEIRHRLDTYIALLHGASGLFSASQDVTAAEFRAYIKRLQLREMYPGIQGVGFAARVRPAERAQFLAKMRRAGFSDFQIKPAGLRAESVVVTYLEPLNDRNRVALGYDMYAEPTRQEALRHAIQSGSAFASGKVRLVQEIDGAPQAGFLIYVPVYQDDLLPATEAERRQWLRGFAYSPFRADDLLRGILGERTLEVDFEVYDGAPRPENLLHRSNPAKLADSAPAPRWTATTQLEIAGRPWTLIFAARPEFARASNRELAGDVLAGGLFLSLVLFVLTRAQTQAQAEIGAAATALQQSRQALSESEERYRTITETASDAIFTIDAHNTIRFANRAAEKLFGHALAAMLNQPLTLLLPAVPCDLRPQPAGESAEIMGLHQDGHEIPLEISFGEFTRNGQRYFTAVARDISERKQAEAALRAARDELERRVQERTHELAAANAELGAQICQRLQAEDTLEALNQELQRSNRELQDFAFVASHDLQEPLRKIQAFGDLLLKHYAGALGEEGRDFLTRMQKAAQRMHSLINELLAFSRVTTQAQPFALVDLNKVAAEVLEDLETRLRQSGGQVEVGALPTLAGDPVQMRQLLQNLLGNALKFHRPGVPPRVRLSAQQLADEQVRLRIADKGIGFDEKYLDRIFTPFQRLHARGEYEGTGMGLAVCRKIVERHGGQITARSRPGAGTTFLVTLPLRQSTAALPVVTKTVEEAAAAGHY